MAGFSDLVTDPALTTPGNAIPRDSLSSMTVLLTLTKPQRAAVLRRITSFNRSHVSRLKFLTAFQLNRDALKWKDFCK